jgi:hypothetical protein
MNLYRKTGRMEWLLHLWIRSLVVKMLGAPPSINEHITLLMEENRSCCYVWFNPVKYMVVVCLVPWWPFICLLSSAFTIGTQLKDKSTLSNQREEEWDQNPSTKSTFHGLTGNLLPVSLTPVLIKEKISILVLLCDLWWVLTIYEAVLAFSCFVEHTFFFYFSSCFGMYSMLRRIEFLSNTITIIRAT